MSYVSIKRAALALMLSVPVAHLTAQTGNAPTLPNAPPNLLLLVHHLFVNHDTATLWLSQHSLQCRLPTDATVVVNKFTDLPLISIWDFILEQLQLPKPSKPVVQPSLRDIEQALGGKRLVLILDELEQGIKVINDPIVRHQN